MNVRAALSERYDDLLRSSVLDHDPTDRLDLVATRGRHLLMLRLIDEHLDGRRETILDLGPGNGAFLRLAGDVGFARLVAVDHTPWEPHRSFLSDLTNVELLGANFNQPGFLAEIDDGSVDVVVTTEVLEHVFNHPWGYLCECWRTIRPGGLLAITTPNPSTFANAIRLVAGRPTLWNDEWFAKAPKVENGQLVGYPFIHYREYPPSVFRGLLGDLPASSIVESGFVANEASASALKTAALRSLRMLRLDHWRPVSHTQYALVQKLAG